MLPELPPTFATSRDSLRALACYAISPARKAETGRIGLRSHEGGIATPPFDDGSRICVNGASLVSRSGEVAPITSVAAAARFLGIELSADPGVGHDLPPFDPDADLAVDHDGSVALGAWYGYGQSVLDRLAMAVPSGATVSEAQLWPEHFDLAVVVELAGGGEGQRANVGFSPGDAFHTEPYLYVGPYDTAALDRSDGYWNAPFGASVGYSALRAEADPLAFVLEGIARLAK